MAIKDKTQPGSDVLQLLSREHPGGEQILVEDLSTNFIFFRDFMKRPFFGLPLSSSQNVKERKRGEERENCNTNTACPFLFAVAYRNSKTAT